MSKLVQQLVNVNAAIALLEDTPARMINLDRWVHRSHLRQWLLGGKMTPTEREVRGHALGISVCLGGLIACDPYFQALGVKRHPHAGLPYLEAYCYHNGFAVSEELFGDQYMFHSTACEEEQTLVLGASHKTIAMNRLHKRRTEIMDALDREHVEQLALARLTARMAQRVDILC